MSTGHDLPHCDGEVCITCSDEAVEVRILRLLDDGLAIVDTGVSEEEVSIALVTASVGDRVLVHAKEAIAALGPVDDATTHAATGGAR